MEVMIERERPDAAESMLLIDELDAVLKPQYPAESSHGYSVQTLIEQDVNFFVARYGEDAAGCAGVQFYLDDDPAYGEVKRMYVRPTHRGLGIAKLLLAELEACAAENGVTILRLETGIYQTEAIALYERMGFVEIDPFGSYLPDPNSRFFEKRLVH